MSGCFGNSREDRYFEKQLNDYLDSQDFDGCQECQEQQAENQCSKCNKELCKDCTREINDDYFCDECFPECNCGDKALILCKHTESWCCGEGYHNCKDCYEGDGAAFDVKRTTNEDGSKEI